LQEALSPLPVQNQISHWVGETALQWQSAIGNGTKALFNDPDKLYELVKDGKMLNAFNGSDPIYDVDYYKRTFFGAAMNTVWRTGQDRKRRSP
jgi:hypothetical protein